LSHRCILDSPNIIARIYAFVKRYGGKIPEIFFHSSEK